MGQDGVIPRGSLPFSEKKGRRKGEDSVREDWTINE